MDVVLRNMPTFSTGEKFKILAQCLYKGTCPKMITYKNNYGKEKCNISCLRNQK